MPVPEWEKVTASSTDQTERLMVPGGWLVCRINGLHLPQSLASWFVPDPEHQWDLN